MKEESLKNRVATVTAAASGIGFAIPKALAEAGATCVLANVDTDAGERARAVLEKLHPGCAIVKTDISRTEEVRELVAGTVAKL